MRPLKKTVGFLQSWHVLCYHLEVSKTFHLYEIQERSDGNQMVVTEADGWLGSTGGLWSDGEGSLSHLDDGYMGVCDCQNSSKWKSELFVFYHT